MVLPARPSYRQDGGLQEENDEFFEAEAVPNKGDLSTKGDVASKDDEHRASQESQGDKQEGRSSSVRATVGSQQPTEESGGIGVFSQNTLANAQDTLANASEQFRYKMLLYTQRRSQVQKLLYRLRGSPFEGCGICACSQRFTLKR